MFKKFRLYISPFFLSRYYLSLDIKNALSKYSFKGNIIDIGCGSKPFKSFFSKTIDYQGIDFENYSINKDFPVEAPDYFFDDKYSLSFRLPFKTNQFDNAVAFQVLEHHKNPSILIEEMFRVVKKNGYVMFSFPFLGGIHEEPNDYYRLTIFTIKYLIKINEGKILLVKSQGSLFSTISMLMNEYLNDFASKGKLKYYFSILIFPPFLIFEYISLILDFCFKSEKIFINYLVLAKNEKDK